MSSDGENEADVLGMLGASASLCISDIPFSGPMGAVRVGRIEGELVINPTNTQLEESDLDIIVSGTRDSLASVEGGAHEIPEADLLEALKFGHIHIQELVELQDALVEKIGKEKYQDHKIDIILHYYLCVFKNGILKLSEHENFSWIEKKDFDRYDFAEGDGNILSLL